MSVIEVAKVNDIPEGAVKSFAIEGRPILISRIGGKFYALDNTCTHMGGDLSKGKLDGKTITCPRHGAKFDIASGECISGPKIGIFKPKGKSTNVYEVQVEGDSIKVNI